MTEFLLVRLLHFIGFVAWVSGLVSTALLLRAGAKAKTGAIIADAGATIAIISGIYRAVTGGLFVQPWLHIKLALIAALLGIHVALRVRVRKAVGTSAGSMLVTVAVLVLLILYVIELRPFMKP
jgi:uncharacterized membrane protein